jgi:hypothetical protein
VSPAEDDATVYPYQPILRDLRGISSALAALRSAPPDRAAALKALSGVYLTRHGIAFSHPVYRKQLARLDPAFERIAWGAQGHLPRPLDVVPEYRQIEAGENGRAIASLEPKERSLAAELDARLDRMAGLLAKAAVLAGAGVPSGRPGEK